MKALEERIKKDGKILPGDILKIGSFLNQQVDTRLLKAMAVEVNNEFPEEITKILTVEASGIAFATAIGLEMGVNVVFAKKSKSSNVSGELVTAQVYSYTHQNMNNISINREYIRKGEKVLIADDFLATGNALVGLIDLVKQCGGEVVGCVCQVEKAYQGGGKKLREEGYKVLSLAKISKMTDNSVEFEKE